MSSRNKNASQSPPPISGARTRQVRHSERGLQFLERSDLHHLEGTHDRRANHGELILVILMLDL